MPARDLKQLAREIAAAKQWFGLSAIAAVRSRYEAGRDGFWLNRHLTSTGVDSRVVDSSSIEVNRRQRRAKSDRLDVRKQLGMLLRYHAGESKVWSVVRVPTVDEEDRRQLHRELRTLRKERTRADRSQLQQLFGANRLVKHISTKDRPQRRPSVYLRLTSSSFARC